MAVAYSVRAQALPLVSTPLEWDEIAGAVDAREWRQLMFGPGEVLDRVADRGDLWAPLLAGAQRLPALSV